jgi:hypothetical protein
MNGKYLLKWGTLLVAFALMATARAQNYAVDWHAIVAGGGTSSNAGYAVTGTIGQSTTTHSENGRFAIDSGFWGFAAAIQMQGAPWLTIHQSSAGTLTISWASPSTGFVLQSAADLAATDWTIVNTTPTDDGITRTLVIPLDSGNHYFRLIKTPSAL